MSELEDYIRARLNEAERAHDLWCQRCGTGKIFDDGRCMICGMRPSVDGPPRPFEPRGIGS